MKKHTFDAPDLLCIDAQGATLPILQGMGKKLKKVKYIIAEVQFIRYYEGESLYPKIVAYLEKNGIKEVIKASNGLFADILFVNQNTSKNSKN